MIRNEIFPIDIKTPGVGDFVPTVTAYLPEDSGDVRPAVVIFAGGAYKVVSQYEAAPTARLFAERGFAAFCVQYSCLPAIFPQSLVEGLWVIRYLRAHVEQYGIDPTRIFAMGFSAGGHLVAAMGTLWNWEGLEPFLGESREDCRPDRTVLCYPVISNEGAFHRDSFRNLLGAQGFSDEKLRELTCLEKQVGSHTPPTFLWHGAADRDVPAEGSVRFVSALLAHGIPVEFHLYPFAPHGGGLNRNTDYADWVNRAERFLLDRRLNTEAKQ